MVIAVNTISLLKQEDHKNFICECVSRIAKLYPQHTFIFISSQSYDFLPVFPVNIIPVVLQIRSIKPLWLKLWHRYKISSVLKKYKAGIYLTSDLSCSLRTRIPQLVIINDPGYLPEPGSKLKNKVNSREKYLPGLLGKARMITTLSEFCKREISNNYKIELSKIDVIYTGISEIFKPVDLAEKEKIVQQYSDGNEYFLFPCSIYNEGILLTLLKAFSLFKKWQKSSMQLLIVPGTTLKANEYTRHLRLFKYREDVKLLENISAGKLAKITASAYVMIYTFTPKGFNVPPMQAMKCNIPVITVNIGAMSEICGDAALYADPFSQDDIAQKMMLIFKDEKLRQELVKKGCGQIKKYSWDRTCGLLWQSILKASG